MQKTDTTESGHGAASPCPEEVQVSLVFFGERTVEGRQIEKQSDYIIDLQGSDLRGVWLSTSANLERVRLSYSNLSGRCFQALRGYRGIGLLELMQIPAIHPSSRT